MPEVVRFFPAEAMAVCQQTVYLKATWADKWFPFTNLWCEEANWSVAPTIPTASLRWRYGRALFPGTEGFEIVSPLSGKMRWYVRVDYDVSPTDGADESPLVRSWYGTLEVELDEQHGVFIQDPGAGEATTRRSGRQHFVAYGLEGILDRSYIDRSVIAPLGTIVPRAIGFNPGLAEVAFDADTVVTPREGNRSAELGPDGVYVFHGSRTGGAKWTTKTAVEYLLRYCTGRNEADEIRVPFVLADVWGALPTWDEPIEPCEGFTVYELLNRLIARERGLGWSAEVVSDEGFGDSVIIAPFTVFDEEVALDESRVINANPKTKIVAYERDRGALAVLNQSELNRVDQVVVRGERRTSTATFSFIDGTLDIGWPASLETAYEQGASLDPGYPALAEVASQELWNDIARSADKFKPVYTRFIFQAGLRGVGDGTSGSEVATIVLMPADKTDEEGDDVPSPHAPEDQRFLPYLALLEGYIYDGDAIDSLNPVNNGGGKAAKHMQPLVLFKRKNLDDADVTQRWRHAESNGLTADLQTNDWAEDQFFSAHVRVDPDDGALWVSLHEAFNHLLAKTDFIPLASDPHDFLADYRTDMIATLTVPWSQYTEARHPPVPVESEHVRRMFIDAPNFRADYVTPFTVVEIDTNGTLLRTDSGGYVRDDRPELASVAVLAFAWYGRQHQALSLSTSLVNNHLQLGDLIVSIGDPELPGELHKADVLSVVSQITIQTPLAEGEGAAGADPPLPRIEYETAYGELDPFKLVPRHFR